MRKLTRLGAALAAGTAVTSTLSLAAPPAPVQAATTTSRGINCSDINFGRYFTIKHGYDGREAKAAECLLHDAGFSAHRNGHISWHDVAEIKAFQRSRRLPVTGQVDTRTWMALLSRGATPVLSWGSRGPSVWRAQRALIASGRKVYLNGTVGSSTLSAVRSLDATLGYRYTARVNGGEWRALQAGRGAKVASAPATPKAASYSSSTKGQIALAFAKRHIGDAYVFDGSGPHVWDCSGLTQAAWRAAGVSLPHSSQLQYNYGTHISKSQLRPGDLVFFYSGRSHVALYAGNGLVLHASRPGTPVGYLPMKYMPFNGATRPA